MTGSLVLAAMLLFVLAVRMSAFFSGSETGFYRLSRIRLSLEAQAGDPVARRLVWFCRHPERFVATALVGNNIANYLTTVAVGFLAMAWTPDRSGVAEIVLTLLSSPIIFIWGELIPKSVYLRAPMKLLRKHARALMAWYYLLRPVTVPLALISRLVERLGSMEKHPLELLFGRNRLVHVLDQGHSEGLLKDVQRRVVESVLDMSEHPVESSMTPLPRLVGVSEAATPEEALEVSRRLGLSHVLVHREENASEWIGYVGAADLNACESIADRLCPVAEIQKGTRKLSALQQLRMQHAFFGLVRENGRVIGAVNERGLVTQLFRPRQLPPQSINAVA